LRNVFLEQIRDRFVPFWPAYRQRLASISQRIVHIAQATLEISGKDVFVDAKKDSMRVKFLQSISRLDYKVIHLIRDVRGAVTSIMKHSPRSVARATRVWYTANMNAERARRYVAPHQWLRLRYDDLCDDPQGTIDRIADFVGVQRAKMPEDFYTVEHHIIGNYMRLRQGAGVIKQDESWKACLTEQALATVMRIGGKANRYFGHDWP
jgi:hypothetical protein